MKKRCTNSCCRRIFTYSSSCADIICPHCQKVYPRLSSLDPKQKLAWRRQKALEQKAAICIDELDLSVRAYNCLRRAGIKKVGDLMSMTTEDVFSIRNMGRKSTEEVLNRLISMDIILEGME